jgi:hypothetical protein
MDEPKSQSLHVYLLEQSAFEGLRLGDLGGDAFDLAVDGGKKIGDLGLGTVGSSILRHWTIFPERIDPFPDPID